jgi:hypothetical protein
MEEVVLITFDLGHVSPAVQSCIGGMVDQMGADKGAAGRADDYAIERSFRDTRPCRSYEEPARYSRSVCGMFQEFGDVA